MGIQWEHHGNIIGFCGILNGIIILYIPIYPIFFTHPKWVNMCVNTLLYHCSHTMWKNVYWIPCFVTFYFVPLKLECRNGSCRLATEASRFSLEGHDLRQAFEDAFEKNRQDEMGFTSFELLLLLGLVGGFSFSYTFIHFLFLGGNMLNHQSYLSPRAWDSVAAPMVPSIPTVILSPFVSTGCRSCEKSAPKWRMHWCNPQLCHGIRRSAAVSCWKVSCVNRRFIWYGLICIDQDHW